MPETLTQPTAFASCPFCTYLARLSGDTEAEAGSSLRRILLAHVVDMHPDRRATDWRDLRPLDDLVVVMRAKDGPRG